MASSDVIELGSSDDEVEPVPKKKKHTLNAMVHIPTKGSALLKKEVKPVSLHLQKVLAGGAITVTNVKKTKVAPQPYKSNSKGRIVQKSELPVVRHGTNANPIAVKNNLSINPLSLMKKQTTMKVHSPKINLPPGIIVKRTAVSQKPLPNILLNRKQISNKRNRSGKVITTVELDDEEVPLTTGISPQWYLRPEEQIHQASENENDESVEKQDTVIEKNNDMEKENNKEPDTRNFIEITIEDSPIKSLHTMKGFEVGSQIPITIDDSPVKHIKEKPCVLDGDMKKTSVVEPQSKKRLDYPDDVEDVTMMGAQNIVEIDFEIDPSANGSNENSIGNKSDNVTVKSNKVLETKNVNAPRRVSTICLTKEVGGNGRDNDLDKCKLSVAKTDSGEFHPVYQKFIDLCFELENSDDMTKIVEKKIKTYYRQCPKCYVESEEFTDMVSSKIFAMKATPDKMYLFIKDIVDELNLQRKAAKSLGVTNKEHEKAVSECENYFSADDTEGNSKRRRQIRKLEKTIKKLHRAIQKLEEQEVEFEDEEDSVYLLTERYKERLIRVHAKFCQLTNTKMPSEPRIQLEARPGQPSGPVKRLEKWVNKKVPIGTPLPFPDFHDVLRCVRDANDEDRLGWSEADIMEEARDLFTRCGKKLQRRRQENEWRIAVSRISYDMSTTDPAEHSENLKLKLDENRSLAAKKEIDLFNKYADKQNQLKLVGEEIGDKEAEESPVESEDDEATDESNSLEDKEKRKDRLKRLLQEKTKKLCSENEHLSNEAQVNLEENENKNEEEKMECAAATTSLEKTENEENEPINDVEVVNNDTITNSLKDTSTSNDENHEKSFDSSKYDFDSDIDELHLLQKLYSENEINSSTQGSDSETPIAISDTLDSDSDTGNVQIHKSDDIISIENSSYSESEMTKNEYESLQPDEVIKDGVCDLVLKNTEVQQKFMFMDKLYEEDENILLASSGEENTDTHINTSTMKEIADDKIISEMISDSCNKNDLKNNVTHTSYSEGKMDKMTTADHCDGDVLDNSEKIICEPSNTQLENDNPIDKSMDIELSFQKNTDIIEPLNGNTSKNILLTNTIVCDEINCDPVKINIDNIETIACQSGTDKCEENYKKNKPVNETSQINKVELDKTTTGEINSDHYPNNNFNEFQESIGIDVSDKNAINDISIQKDLKDCDMNDATVEIAEGGSPLANSPTC